MTDCNTDPIVFSSLGRQQVVADFTGGAITSDAGLLLLRERMKQGRANETGTGAIVLYLVTLPAAWLLAVPAARRFYRSCKLATAILWMLIVFSAYFWVAGGIMLLHTAYS